MMTHGPVLEALTRRLSECPEVFLLEPYVAGRTPSGIDVAAVVSDLLEDLGGAETGLTEEEIRTLEYSNVHDRNRLRLILVACWLCHDEWFLERKQFALRVKAWLSSGLYALADTVVADSFVTDPDRREELARLLLVALGLLPSGETKEQADIRLAALDSVERARVVRGTSHHRERARSLREAMNAAKARQAAARYSSE